MKIVWRKNVMDVVKNYGFFKEMFIFRLMVMVPNVKFIVENVMIKKPKKELISK
jgi:hypothetical protein